MPGSTFGFRPHRACMFPAVRNILGGQEKLIERQRKTRLRFGGERSRDFFRLCQLLLYRKRPCGQAPRRKRAPSGGVPSGVLICSTERSRTSNSAAVLLFRLAAGFARYAHFDGPRQLWKLRAEVDGEKSRCQRQRPVSGSAAQRPSHKPSGIYSQEPDQVVARNRSGSKHHRVPPPKVGSLSRCRYRPDLPHAGENTLSSTFAQSGSFSDWRRRKSPAAAAVEWIQVGGNSPALRSRPS